MYQNIQKNQNIIRDTQPEIHINFIKGAFVEIKNGKSKNYRVEFINKSNGAIEHSATIGNNCWVKTSKSYFVNWLIKITDDNQKTFIFEQNFKNKRVYIALDSKALGDTLAWFPYIEEFRKKWNCKVVCSTFHNYLFEENYPNIEFIKPGEVAHNLYAMYTIGWFYNDDGTINTYKVPNDFKNIPLQKTASDILGLEYIEVIPKIKKKKNVLKEKLISIAIHGTTQAKYWNNPTGWQEVVDYLKGLGYRVILLSKENTGYMGNWHPQGIEKLPEGPLEQVIETLQKSEMFIGIGSGLSWLSWATGTTTCMISGFSYPFTETKLNTIRISAPTNKCSGCFNTHRLDAGDWNWCPMHKDTDRQFECTKLIKSEDVISSIRSYL